jgi:large subunit ribosomal protein L7/L12
MKITQEDILEYLEKCNMLQLNELVKKIEDKFDVVAVQPVQTIAVEEVQKEEKPSTVNLVLKNAGKERLKVIKFIKTEFGTPLLEAKNLVDKAPIVIKENIIPEEADKLKLKFEEVGAEMEIN